MVVVGHPEKCTQCVQCAQCEPPLLAPGNEQDHKFATATGLAALDEQAEYNCCDVNTGNCQMVP